MDAAAAQSPEGAGFPGNGVPPQDNSPGDLGPHEPALTEFEANASGLTNGDTLVPIEQQLQQIRELQQTAWPSEAPGSSTPPLPAPTTGADNATHSPSPVPDQSASYNHTALTSAAVAAAGAAGPGSSPWHSQAAEHIGVHAAAAAPDPAEALCPQAAGAGDLEAIPHPAEQAPSMPHDDADDDVIGHGTHDQQQQQQQQQLTDGDDLEQLSAFWEEAVHLPDEATRHQAVQEHLSRVEDR